MNAKKLLMLSLLMPCFIFTSDNDDFELSKSNDDTELIVTLNDDNLGGNDDDNLLGEKISLENTHHEINHKGDDSNEILVIDKNPNDETDSNGLIISHEEVKSEVREALESLGVGTLAATALLNNSYGRIALVCFLGYKSFKNFKKALYEKLNRNSHVTKGLSYLVAAGMMSQDGYAWLLSH